MKGARSTHDLVILAKAQGCAAKSWGGEGKEIASPISSWPGSARLGPAIHALGRSRQRRGWADQIRARRLEIVSCGSGTSSSFKKIFPGQPCAKAGIHLDQWLWIPALRLATAGMTNSNSGNF